MPNAKTEPTFTINNKTLGIRQYIWHHHGAKVEGRAPAITAKVIKLLPGPNVGIKASEWAKVESTKAVEQDIEDGKIEPISNFDIRKVPKRDFKALVKSAASIDALKSWLGTPGLDRDQRQLLNDRIKECTRKAA
jgi:hypothetical protein